MSNVPDSTEPKPHDDRAPTPVLSAATSAEPAATGSPWARASVCVVGAALVAGFLAWGIGEKTHAYYPPVVKRRGDSRDFRAVNQALRVADQQNTALTFGTFGAVLGMLLGVVGGALRRSIPGGASAALAGFLLGGIGGALVSYEVAPIFARFYSDESPSLLLSFLVRGGIWAVVGMTAGLAFGGAWQGLPGIPRTLIGGLVGSICGTIAFEMVNAVLFPGDRNDAVIPSSMQARLLAYLLVSVGVGIGAVVFGRPRSWTTSGTAQAHS